jgi:DNA polymerase III delta subunit
VVRVTHYVEGLEAAAKGRTKLGDDPLAPLLAQVAPEGPPPFVLIFEATQAKGLPVEAAVERLGVWVHLPAMDGEGLEEWLRAQGGPYGISVDRGVGRRIADRVGLEHAALLRSEAERLLCEAGPGGRIDARLVDASVDPSREEAIWAISDALSAGDVLRATSLADRMLERDGKDADRQLGGIVGYLVTHYRRCLQVVARAEAGEGPGEIAAATGVKDWQLRRILEGHRRAGSGVLVQAMRSLEEADRTRKSSALGDRKVSQRLWLERLFLALARGEPMRRRLEAPSALDSLGQG